MTNFASNYGGPEVPNKTIFWEHKHNDISQNITIKQKTLRH